MDRNYLVTQIRAHLLGCFELALFMKSGINLFENSQSALKISIVVTLLCMLSGIPVIVESPSLAGADDGGAAGIATYILRFVASWGLFLASMYKITEWLERPQHYQHMIVIYNWLCIPQAVLTMAGYLLMISGNHEWEHIYGYFIFVLLYGVSVASFMLTNVLRIHPAMGVFITMWSVVIQIIVYLLVNGASYTGE